MYTYTHAHTQIKGIIKNLLTFLYPGTSAFMGYTGQNSRIQQSQIEASTESLHSPQEQYILSSPPSYDDVMKEINMNYVAGTVHLVSQCV